MVDFCAMVHTPGALGLPARALNGLRTVYVLHVSRASRAVLRADKAEAYPGIRGAPRLRSRPAARRNGRRAGRGRQQAGRSGCRWLISRPIVGGCPAAAGCFSPA
jgi:hypothetical protein